MSSVQPSASNGYFIPHDFTLSRANLQALVSSIHERLQAREDLEADFEALVAQGTQQALALIQTNVAPQLATLRAQVAAADAELEAALAIVAQITGSNLPATQVTETAARRFVPAAPDATKRMLLASTSSLAFEVAVAVDAQGHVDIPALRLPWARVTGVPASFPPSAHTHQVEQVAGLEVQLGALAAAITAREPALPVAGGDATQRYLRGDKTWAPVSDIRRAVATSEQALAGEENTTVITPLRLRDGLNAAGGAPVYACRAWVNFNGITSPPTIRASGNVQSVTRNGAGDYTINFETAMPDANYAVVATGVGANTGNVSTAVVVAGSTAPVAALKSTTQLRVQSGSSASGALISIDEISVAIFR